MTGHWTLLLDSVTERVYEGIIWDEWDVGQMQLACLLVVPRETSQAQGDEGSILKDGVIFESINFMMSIWMG